MNGETAAVTGSTSGIGLGIAARVSAKLGEGVLNGLMTARFGLAALAVCRPLPFIREQAPSVNDVAGELFALLERAQVPYATKEAVHAAATSAAPLAVRLSRVQALDVGRALETAVFELLLAHPEEHG